MKPTILITAALVATALSAGARAADYEVQRSIQLPSSSVEVWARVGDFCDIDDWHPGIAACDLKVIEGSLHRVLTTAEGSEIVERRIAAEPGLSYTYRMSATPMPVANYTATFSVEPGEGTRVSWSARFSADDPAMEVAVAALIEDGLAAIERALTAE